MAILLFTSECHEDKFEEEVELPDEALELAEEPEDLEILIQSALEKFFDENPPKRGYWTRGEEIRNAKFIQNMAITGEYQIDREDAREWFNSFTGRREILAIREDMGEIGPTDWKELESLETRLEETKVSKAFTDDKASTEYQLSIIRGTMEELRAMTREPIVYPEEEKRYSDLIREAREAGVETGIRDVATITAKGEEYTVRYYPIAMRTGAGEGYEEDVYMVYDEDGRLTKRFVGERPTGRTLREYV